MVMSSAHHILSTLLGSRVTAITENDLFSHGAHRLLSLGLGLEEETHTLSVYPAMHWASFPK